MGRAVDPDASLRFGLRALRLGALGLDPAPSSGSFAASSCSSSPASTSTSPGRSRCPVLLGENLRGAQALGRSRALVRGRFWPCLGVLVLDRRARGHRRARVIALVISAIIGASDNDTVLFFEQGVSTLIANTLVLPFQVAVTTVLYIDLRVRKEGFDIQLLTHSLEPGGAGET